MYADIERSMGVSPLGIQRIGLRSMVASIDTDGIYVFLQFLSLSVYVYETIWPKPGFVVIFF